MEKPRGPMEGEESKESSNKRWRGDRESDRIREGGEKEEISDVVESESICFKRHVRSAQGDS